MTVGFLQLPENRNPNSRRRADGGQYWGYPTRTAQVQIIGIHTTESAPGYGAALAVGGYFTRSTRPASYHEMNDVGDYLTCLPPEATAFGAVGWNSNGWHYSFVTRAHLWGRSPVRDAAMLRIGAERCRIAAERFGIPPRRITLAQARQGAKGFIDHGRLDPGRRSDPGANFPWAKFLALVSEEDDDMTPAQERLLNDTAAAVARIEKALTREGRIGDDLGRLRRSVRYDAQRHGYPVADSLAEVGEVDA